MPSIKIINNPIEINLNNKWVPATKFNSKDRIVAQNGHKIGSGYKGRQYRIIEKRERTFSSLERFGRGLLGTVAVVCTLCFALFSKSVRNLFTKPKENIRFAVLEPTANLSSTFVGNQLTLTNTILPKHNSVRNLFTKPKENIRFAVLEPTANLSSTFVGNQLTPINTILPKHNSEKTVQKQKILPFIEKDANEIEDSIKKFKNEALNVFCKSIQQEPLLDFTLTQEQQKSLLEANSNKYYSKPLQGVKIIGGGCNFVIFLDSVPGFVFKPMEDEIAGKSYIDEVEKARRVISENNLHLIHVPQSKLVEISGKYFVMQEKADLISEDYNGLKGIYSHCWDDKKMNGYIKAIFSQILEFISKTGFSDVKYDNIPLTMNGHVALIDIDRGSVIGGLTKGCAGKNDGLFNYIPYEYFDEFLSIAKEKLENNDYQSLLKEIDAIKNRKKEKVNKKEDYSQFCQKNAISFASQSINPNLIKIFDDKKKQDFALSIVTSLNESLSKSKNFSTQIGRTVTLAINNSDHLFKRAKQIWGDQFPYLPFDPKNVAFKNILPEVLEGLKNSGYIYKYKISAYYPYVKVVC